MLKRIALLLLLVCLLFMPGSVSADKDYVAEIYDVDMQVGSDGSMQVTETITFRFMGGPFTYVYRTLGSDLSGRSTSCEVIGLLLMN